MSDIHGASPDPADLPELDAPAAADRDLPARLEGLAGRLQERADYYRSLEPEEMREELEAGIRARPLLSVAVAVSVGFILGRFIRD